MTLKFDALAEVFLILNDFSVNIFLDEIGLFTNMRQHIPTRLLDGGRGEFRTDVALGEALFVHATSLSNI